MIICCSFVVGAQSVKTAVWKTFAPENEEFWVDIPIALNASAFQNDNSNDDFNRRYLNSLDGTYFYIFSDNPQRPAQFKYVNEIIRVYKQTGKAEKIGKFETVKYAFVDDENFQHIILTVKSENRFYVFQTLSPSKENAAADRFFRSLKLFEKGSRENFFEMQNEKGITVTIPNTIGESVPENERTSYNYDIGAPDDKHAKVPKPVSVPKNQKSSKTKDLPTAELNISKRPEAKFTDFAIFYEMRGTITLSITFLADGTIGKITPVSKLPFGLTQQAIAAARKIEFSPAKLEGIAYTVIKTVEYSFIKK